MAKIELTDNELKNLVVFLARCDLKGAEVQEFSKILYALSNPIVEELKTESK